jgi:hypothetical protein
VNGSIPFFCRKTPFGIDPAEGFQSERTNNVVFPYAIQGRRQQGVVARSKDILQIFDYLNVLVSHTDAEHLHVAGHQPGDVTVKELGFPDEFRIAVSHEDIPCLRDIFSSMRHLHIEENRKLMMLHDCTLLVYTAFGNCSRFMV